MAISCTAVALVALVAAFLRRPLAERGSRLAAGGFLQATSLSIPVVAGRIGVEMRVIWRERATVALVTAGLVPAIAFPRAALALLRGRGGSPALDAVTRSI